jgi:hypothetical protein
MLLLAAAGGAAAAGAGVLLGASGSYSGELFVRHRALGFGLVVSTALAAGAWWAARLRPGRLARVVYGVLLVHTLALLVGVGHLGGSLTHGEGYLTENAPSWRRGLLAPEPVDLGEEPPVGQRVVFEALVQPVLQRRCVSCHGSEDPRGGLRLDTVDGIRAGGDGGAVVVPGRPAASPLWGRVALPPSHPDVMPPRGRRPPSVAEGTLLHWWIAEGASFEATVAELEVGPETRPVVEALLGPLPLPGPTLPPEDVDPADPAAVAGAEGAGFRVKSVAEESPFVQVAGSPQIDDGALERLRPLADQVVWLDLGGTGVSDAGLETVGELRNLVRLDLSGTAVTDSGVGSLGALSRLESLNLHDTAVTDAGLGGLGELPRLRRLYLWRTATTGDGVEALATAHPDLEVTGGSVED